VSKEMATLLQEFGLTDAEARVYLALLEGNSTKSGITRSSGVSSSIVYDVLGRLTGKGLVSSSLVGGKKHFRASDPDILLSKVEERFEGQKEIAKRLFPILKGKRGARSRVFFAEVYEGFDGFKSMLNGLEQEFKKGEYVKWLAMGITEHKKGAFNSAWVYWHTNVRPSYGIKARFLFSDKDSEYSRELCRTPQSECRYLVSQTPTCVTVVGDIVLIMKYSEPPRFVFMKDKDIATTFRETFRELWEKAGSG
jgi:predicted transcriptional regulator